MKKITLLLIAVFALSFQMNAQITTYPYSEDFEAGDGGWVADNTTNGTWALGTPAGTIINAAASGTNAWATNLAGTYNINEDSWVTSPVFDFSALAGAAITVNIWYDSEFSWDGTVLQSSIDGGASWQNVGAQGDPTNWFTDNTIGGNPGGQQIGWTGTGATSSGGYVSATHELNGLGGQASVLLRFAFGSDGSVVDDGFAFDDVMITEVTCAAPSMLTASNETATTADLGWSDPANSAWNIEIVDITAGGTQTMTATASGVANPYMATGLVESNNYEFYVQADCGSVWIGPFAFSTTAACPDPSNLNATNLTSTGADLSWDQTGGVSPWNVEIVDITAGGTQTMTATASGVTNPYSATGLEAQNDYEYYVQVDCSANWVGPFAFTTACNAFTAPYTEDFETFTTGAAAFGTENCWSGTGGAYYWESAPGTDTGSGNTGPDPTITTGNYFYTEASGGTAGDITELLAPSVDLTGLTAPSLGFDYHMFGGQIGTLDVVVNGTVEFTITGEQQTLATDPFLTSYVDLIAYAGQTVQVTFRATSAGTFEGDISIDNIVYGELPSCFDPSMLTASNITDTSADLGWTENGTATAWNVELVDITAGGTVTGTATASGVVNPYMATGLSSNNDYEFYVQADCGSSWVGPFAFTTACSAFTAPYTEDFNAATTVPDCWNMSGSENWIFATTGGHVDNAGTITGATASGGNFAYVDDSTPDNTGTTLTSPLVDVSGLTTPALSFYEVSNNEGFSNVTLTVDVWDGAAWNTVGTYNTNTAGWELKIIDLSGLTFTGPAQARFVVDEAPTGDFYDDVAIDDVTFGELPTCLPPTAVTNTVLTDMTADFTWAAGGTEDTWEYANVPSPSTDPASGTSTMAMMASFTGLTPETGYDFYVRSDCGGSMSAWVKVSYTTPATPPENDDIANATAITIGEMICDGTTNNGTNVAASDSGEGAGACYVGGAGSDVWYTFTITGDFDVTVSTDYLGGTLVDTQIAIFSGTPGALVEEACSQDEGVVILSNGSSWNSLISDQSLAAGTYYVQVSGYNGAEGTFCLSVDAVPTPPANDDCANAEALTLGTMVTGDTTNATDSGIAAGACGATGGDQDIWYSFVATTTMTVTIDTDADTVVVYDACGGTEVACVGTGMNDVGGLTDGSTYYARVYNSGIAKVAGPVELTISEATLSTTDFDANSIFSYYPNPVNNTLTLNAQQAITNVAVFNMLGQEVIRTAPNAVSNDVDMSNLQSGAYFVQVTVGTAVETVRIIKN